MENAKRRIKSAGKADWIKSLVISVIILAIGAWALQKAEKNLNINNKRPVLSAPKLKIEINKNTTLYNI